MADGRKAGHDNFNYIVTTWEHRFSEKIHTKTEAYYMWQFDAVVGGTPSLGPPMSFGGGGGLGKYPSRKLSSLRRIELHDVPALEERLFHDPERVVRRHARRAIGLRHQLFQPHDRDHLISSTTTS